MVNTPPYTRIIATSKHFLGYHLESWAGDAQYRLSHSFNYTEADIQQTYFPSFKAALQANVTAIMCSYDGSNTTTPAWPAPHGSEPWGVPLCASTEMERLLRDPSLGWEGYVISDEGSITFTGPGYHGFTSTLLDAAILCLNAGTDLALGGEYAGTLAKALSQGNITEATIRKSLRRLLRAQFSLGWFDSLAALRGSFPDPVPWNNVSEADIGSPAHRALAYSASAASIVLLKNEGALLPLAPTPTTKLALIGPAAAFSGTDTSSYLGNYAGCEGGPGGAVSQDPRCHVVSLLEALTAASTSAAAPFHLAYAPGCSINKKGDMAGFPAALAAAQGADAIIYAGGLNTCQESDCSEGEANDRGVSGGRYPAAGLDLGGEQLALLAQLSSAYPGVPIVVVYFNGGPISSPWVHAHARAVVEAWYPGVEGGSAIGDVLLGRAIPAGRLPVTLVKSMADLPPHTDFVLSTPPGRTHRYSTAAPLLPFGFGLSFVGFTYTALRIVPATLGPQDAAFTVSVTLTRSEEAPPAVAALPADEVVQLFGASGAPAVGLASPPLQQLLAFKRVKALQRGEARSVDFTLQRGALELLSPQGSMQVQAGNWTLTVGGGPPSNAAFGGGAVLTGYLLVQ